MESILSSFLPAIRSLTLPLTKEEMLTERFLIERAGELEMYYSPHNEYINTHAKVVMVGITPGWTQLKTAYEQVIKGIEEDHSHKQILEAAKIAAGFSGSIRKNLTDMLDQLGLPELFNIESSFSLFKENRPLLHTTSVIKYPVFIHGKNYTGHRPKIDQSDLLSYYAYQSFREELEQIEPYALIIPLGKTVEAVFEKLQEEKKLPRHTYLSGFPHPSGANGHRMKQFNHNKNMLTSILQSWISTTT
ncbi:hypothetical protein V1502_03175 [Bacillus sp. SCS-153A]|uniref:hypothetical protein n=1 Tax=Rossellomorea sedimentorum TaxID=3115294 RepID=UPI00390623AC